MSIDNIHYKRLVLQNSLIDSSKMGEPIPHIFAPLKNDYAKGYAIRHFCIHRLNRNILEINSKQEAGFKKETSGANQHLWKHFKLRWKLTGPRNHLISNTGVITRKGVSEQNLIAIQKFKKTIPELKHYLTNVTRHARIEKATLPYITDRYYFGGDPIPVTLPKSYKKQHLQGRWCGNCAHFNVGNICHVWEAKVMGNHWCKSWKMKGGSNAATSPNTVNTQTTQTNQSSTNTGGGSGGSGGSSGGSGGY